MKYDMAKEMLVERDRTLNDKLFLIDEGTVCCCGLRNPLLPMDICILREGDFIGDDIAILAQGHEPRPAWKVRPREAEGQ